MSSQTDPFEDITLGELSAARKKAAARSEAAAAEAPAEADARPASVIALEAAYMLDAMSEAFRRGGPGYKASAAAIRAVVDEAAQLRIDLLIEKRNTEDLAMRIRFGPVGEGMAWQHREVRRQAGAARELPAGSDYATLAGGDGAVLIGGYGSTLTGGDRATLTGGDEAKLTGGHGSRLTGGDYSSLTGCGRSTLIGGDESTLIAGRDSTLIGGFDATLTGGDGSRLIVAYRPTTIDGRFGNIRRRFAVGAVGLGEDDLKPDVPYKWIDGEWVQQNT